MVNFKFIVLLLSFYNYPYLSLCSGFLLRCSSLATTYLLNFRNWCIHELFMLTFFVFGLFAGLICSVMPYFISFLFILKSICE